MKSSHKCEGVVVPMVTPFTSDHHIDNQSAKRITRHLIDNGAIPFILGTTGEASSISVHERAAFTQAVVEAARAEVPVYAGIASNCFQDSVQMAKECHDLGVSYLVAHLPSYYPLNSVQIESYFLRLADSVPLPLMLYNILATTHISIPVDVIYRLSEHPNIVGVKDSEQDLDRQLELIRFCNTQDDFSHFIGWGAKCSIALENGSDGIVPSTGNFVPGLYREMFDACRAGNTLRANELQQLTADLSAIYQKGKILSEALAGLKLIMEEMGLCSRFVRLPLMELQEADHAEITAQVEAYNLKEVTQKAKGTNAV